jgi:hypothetical protein
MKKYLINTKINPALFFFTLIYLVISSSNIYSQNISDFSGEWILNRTKGKTHLTEVASSTIIITQKDLSLTMNITISPDNDKQVKRTENYVLNTSAANKTASPDEKSSRINTKLEPDGQSFSITEIISYTKDGAILKLKRTDKYTISKDSKTLTIETFDTNSENPSNPKDQPQEIRIYDKKI